MLRITKLTDYGIQVLAHLAEHEGQGPRAARDIAGGTCLPLPTVGKILRTLTRAGLLASQRGAQGGYRLARPPEEISVAEIITTFEGPIALTECLSGESATCGVEPICQTRGNWGRISRAIRHALEEIPLSEIARPQRGWSERLSAALALPASDAPGEPS